MARARSKEWHSKVTVAAKKIADAEAAGLRAPMSDLHRRSAERLRDLCRVNGGVYVKLGQHLSQLDFVLPPEFIDVLRCMLDQVSFGGGGGGSVVAQPPRENTVPTPLPRQRYYSIPVLLSGDGVRLHSSFARER